MFRRAARKDAVHDAIVAGLRARGIVVYPMPQPGDILCCHEWKGLLTWMPMELKSGNDIRKKKKGLVGELTSNNRQKTPNLIPIVHSLAEALALFGLSE